MNRKRQQARRANGRFTRNTLANTFGLTVVVCAACRGCNPHDIGAPPPRTCVQCGEVLVDLMEPLRG